ncbi:hypothetical protein J1N35_025367 [Gossypium stocksii]|uniref:Uncharacterized protein n=1 Tax=Gossypium stocksii TaxID=47602 RepID=A0A9D3ZXQ9_9ROSI|nr:hypothetical protein J1N35_025367 [Gossypium stocksii]
MESDEYMEDPSLATRIGIWEQSMSLIQDDLSSISNIVEPILEAIQHRTTTNTPMEEIEHDVLELEASDHSVVIKHDELNIGIRLGVGVDEELNWELSEGLPTKSYTTMGASTKFEDYSTILLFLHWTRWPKTLFD